MGEVDGGLAELLRQALGDVFLGHKTEFDQGLAELSPRLLLKLEGLLELILSDQTGFGQQFAETYAHMAERGLVCTRKCMDYRVLRCCPASVLPRSGTVNALLFGVYRGGCHARMYVAQRRRDRPELQLLADTNRKVEGVVGVPDDEPGVVFPK